MWKADLLPMSEGLNARSEAAVQLELEQCYCKAKSILTQNDIFLKAVAEALVAKKTLLYSDIQAIRSTTVKSDQPMISNTVSQYRGAERAEQLPEAESTEAIRQRLIQRLEERRKHNGPDLPHRPVPLLHNLEKSVYPTRDDFLGGNTMKRTLLLLLALL